jgi:hypothetical protein
MTEKLLQYIWQMQYFNRGDLCTASGEELSIITPGILNRNQGPDFLDARLRIGRETWAGSVELHLLTSGWEAHSHSSDPNFNNVVLHVVWQNDRIGHPLPLLELRDRVPKFLLDRYEELQGSTSFIACENLIHQAEPLVIDHWKDRLLAERTERKAAFVDKMRLENNSAWQELYWWLLARNFGHSVNADSFEAIARSLDLKMISRHSKQIQQLESLLLGQAGLLNRDFVDDYPVMLQKEYHFLRKKYMLIPPPVPVHFLRMRPANFPTIRLAQLAMLVHKGGHHLDLVIEETDLKKLQAAFDVSVNDYWQFHYLPDKPAPWVDKRIGASMFDNILINSIVPILFAYGSFHDREAYKEKAFAWLSNTGSESNNIIHHFRELGIDCRNAGESQALLELRAQYCEKKRCLDCNIGNAILYQR